MRRLVRLALAAVLLLAGCAAGEPGEDPGAGIWEDYQPPALAEEDRAQLPLLAALWEGGRLAREDIKIT